MRYDDIPRRQTAQVYDFREAELRAGKPLSLKVLLPLEEKFNGRTPLWTRQEMEAGKYASPEGAHTVAWPASDALLSEQIGRFLLHVREKWTVHVWCLWHKAFSFEEFLTRYVGDRLNSGEQCRLDEPAAQLLRLATGQPRSLPKKTGARK
jgi:hypothetical protein